MEINSISCFPDIINMKERTNSRPPFYQTKNAVDEVHPHDFPHPPLMAIHMAIRYSTSHKASKAHEQWLVNPGYLHELLPSYVPGLFRKPWKKNWFVFHRP